MEEVSSQVLIQSKQKTPIRTSSNSIRARFGSSRISARTVPDVNDVSRCARCWRFFKCYSSTLFNLNEFPITDTELKLMAAAAKIGLNKIPKNGYSTPAATGTPIEL